MKLWKSSMLVLALILLILSSMSVNAKSDPSGDVYRFTEDMKWEFYGERDAIDVTDVSKSISDSDITLSLTVKGSITDDQKIFYYIHLEKDATSNYIVYYTQNSGRATKNGALADYEDKDPDFTISADGKTLSYTFSDINTSIDYKLWGYATEHVKSGYITSGAWYDYAPDTEAPYYSGADDGNGENGGSETPPPSGTPGFETLAVIAAIGIAFIILRKRK